MPSPFPGMDPYLEDQALWPDFHCQLIAVLCEILRPGLAGDYNVALGKRRYSTATPQGAEEHQEDFVEVRHRSDDRLVTLMDVVSPANKSTAAGRAAYLEQRRSARESPANVVEIDLVLNGQPTLDYSRDGLPDWDYAVTVVRATQLERYEIYTATLQKRLPRFRLPLASDDRDTVLDLHTAFARCYDNGGFFGRIDYCGEPPVLLSDEDGRWLDATLKAKGIREPSPPHDEVALAAYYLWEQEGSPHGRDKEHWHKALKHLRQAKKAGPKGG